MTKILIPLLVALATLALPACHVEPAGAGTTSPPPTEPVAEAGGWRDFERPGEDELRAQLSDLAYSVTRKDDTERPFSSPFNGNKRDGLYVDIISGEPLFSSRDKFDSGTGWPSFTQPITEESLTQRTDYHIGYPRTEVRSAIADSHLGHVFPDGPAPTGLRYCINGAALIFVPAEELEARGYGEFSARFE